MTSQITWLKKRWENQSKGRKTSQDKVGIKQPVGGVGGGGNVELAVSCEVITQRVDVNQSSSD